MKLLTLIVLATLASCVSVNENVEDSWEVEIPMNCRAWDSPDVIESTFVFEVSKSNFDLAAYHLSDSDVLTLEEDQVERYLGFSPNFDNNLQPYLVRALYGHAGTGDFQFNWCGEGIVISHGSLGRFSIINRTAFILFLPKKPEQIYLRVSIAE